MTARVFAHRGEQYTATENTVPAFEVATAGGFGIELDVRYTADGVPVVMHDDTVDRTTNGSGALASKGFSVARTLNSDMGRWARTTIPSLWEALNVSRTAPAIFMELKTAAPSQAALKAAIKAVIDNGVWNKTTIVAFSTTWLAAARSMARSQFGWTPPLGLYFQSDKQVSELQAANITWALPQLGLSWSQYRAAGLSVGIWTPNDAAGWAAAADADALITDYPREAAGFLEGLRSA